MTTKTEARLADGWIPHGGAAGGALCPACQRQPYVHATWCPLPSILAAVRADYDDDDVSAAHPRPMDLFDTLLTIEDGDDD